jgi:hypothetical protein
MNRARLIVLVLLLGEPSVHAQLYERIDVAGRVREHGERFELHIRCASYTPAGSRGVTHFWGGDSPDFRPSSVVSDVRFTLGNHSMSIPRAAYNDLGDTDVPHGPWVSESGEIQVELHGGDAAGGYTCNFYFRDG